MQDKLDPSLRDLEEAKTERSQQSRRNWKKTHDIFVENNKTEAWTIRQESQLYIAKGNMDVDGSVDSIRRREPIICTHT